MTRSKLQVRNKSSLLWSEPLGTRTTSWLHGFWPWTGSGADDGERCRVAGRIAAQVELRCGADRELCAAEAATGRDGGAAPDREDTAP